MKVAFVGVHEMQRQGAEATVRQAFSKSFNMELGPVHNIYWKAANATVSWGTEAVSEAHYSFVGILPRRVC